MTGKDIRIISAEDIYDIIDSDRKSGEFYIYVVLKAAREGATTSFTSVAINREMPITIVEPTNSITKETIGKDGIRYSDKPDTKMHYVYSNKYCNIIKEMIKKTPALEYLPYILLPDKCDGCEHLDNCEFAEVIRDKDLPVIAANYSKLTFVNAGSVNEDSVSELLKGKLMKSNIFLFDEIHYMQNLAPINLPVLYIEKETRNECLMDNLNKYFEEITDLKYKYPSVHEVLIKFKKLMGHKNIKQSIKKVTREALSDNYWDKHISDPLVNPYHVNENIVTKLNLGFSREMCEIVQNNDYGKLDVKYDLCHLYDLLNIVLAQIVTIGFISGKSGVTINISSPNIITLEMMKEFLKELNVYNKRVIFTSATIGDLESDPLSKYWIPENVKIKYLFFGENGSPLQTNSQLLILCDSYKLSNSGGRSLNSQEQLQKIVEEITNIIFVHKIYNCKIVTKSIEDAKKLLKALKDKGINAAFGKTNESNILEITWYKATDTIGVDSTKRVWITVGFAYKPVNRYNNVTRDIVESEAKSHLENHSDFFQTIMRAKGNEPSVVFALGVTYDECINATTWGSRRRIEKIGQNTNDIKVVCDQYIPGPKIKQCFSFNQMLFESILHRNITYNDLFNSTDKLIKFPTNSNGVQSCFEASFSFFKIESPIININGTNDLKKGSQISAEQFLHMISTDEKVGNCSKTDLNQHRQNKKNLKSYTITSDGEAKWLRFGDLSEWDKNRLLSYFNYACIPYKVEKFLHRNKDEMYNVWVFLVPVSARKARDFGKYIINLLTVDKVHIKPSEEEKEFNCKLLPEFVDRKTRKQHEIKLPISKESFMLVNGEYTNTFEIMDAIQCYDLNPIDVDKFGMQVVAFKDKFDRTMYMRKYMSDRNDSEACC